MDILNFTVIDEGKPSTVEVAVGADSVRLSPAALRKALGWELKPQGLCKDDRCVAVHGQTGLLNDDGIDLEALVRLLARPLAVDREERIAYLGASASERSAQLDSLTAPDFTLPDLNGRPHSLSDYRGDKILLVAYASW